jgi:hypothetical protein
VLEALLPAFMTVPTQALQFAAPELDRVVVVRLGDASSDNLAFGLHPVWMTPT